MRIPLIGVKMSTGTLALGAIAFWAAPKILSSLSGILRPVAKTGIKGGMMAYDKGKEVFSGAVDVIQDIASEARSELSKKSGKPTPRKKAAKAE
jgi:hypothetical protein